MPRKKKEEKPKVSPEVAKEVKKRKYPAALDEIEFDVKIGVTHAQNPQNSGYSQGEQAMLEKVKEALSK